MHASFLQGELGSINEAVILDPKIALEQCETLMLDMDGTVLDLAFDNYMWLTHVPERYAAAHGLDPAEAREQLYEKYRAMLGSLEWYCLDHWSEHLGIDIAGLHREQHHRIGYLPGAEAFLGAIRERDVRLLLVTNSHMETLGIKDEVTGITAHFDAVYSSHRFGYPKEAQDFWRALAKAEDFDPATALFVDDTARVLDSAAAFGVEMLVEITYPDTTAAARDTAAHAGIRALGDLIETDRPG